MPQNGVLGNFWAFVPILDGQSYDCPKEREKGDILNTLEGTPEGDQAYNSCLNPARLYFLCAHA